MLIVRFATWVGFVLFTLCAAGLALAQTPPQATPNDRLAWDEVAPDIATAQGYTYALELDGVLRASPLSPVTCTGAASPFVCRVPFPATTPGQHSLRLQASTIVNGKPLSSAFSTALVFTMVISPATPANVRHEPAEEE